MGYHMADGTVTTTGVDGSATGTATIACVPGWLQSIQVDWGATAPATSDITITQAVSPTALLTKSNSSTDATFYPRAACVDTSAAAITNSQTAIWVHGPVTVTIGDCNALAPAVTVYITTWH